MRLAPPSATRPPLVVAGGAHGQYPAQQLHRPGLRADRAEGVAAHHWGGWEKMVMTLFKRARSITTRSYVEMELLDLFALHAAGHGGFQGLALLAPQQGRRNVLGVGHVALPGTGRYLADALGLKSRRVFLSGGGATSRIRFFSHGLRNLRLLTVRFI